jgi:(R)-2-hydroxyglutarate---pyruvate transhydrogenase
MRPKLIRPLVRLPQRVVHRRWAHSITPQLTSPTVDDVAHFARFLPQNAIITTLTDGESKESEEVNELEQYNADWMGKYRGQSRVVLRPKSAQEVSKIMKHCWERRIGVVPQGGNTGLVGASPLYFLYSH